MEKCPRETRVGLSYSVSVGLPLALLDTLRLALILFSTSPSTRCVQESHVGPGREEAARGLVLADRAAAGLLYLDADARGAPHSRRARLQNLARCRQEPAFVAAV